MFLFGTRLETNLFIGEFAVASALCLVYSECGIEHVRVIPQRVGRVLNCLPMALDSYRTIWSK